ncbi:MAG: hypothetical protein IJ180_06150 [Bacteroidales bacterium]|nr:hypothetical protein [Bacteroidales bacterium]
MKKLFLLLTVCMSVYCVGVSQTNSKMISNDRDSISQEKMDSVIATMKRLTSETELRYSKDELAKYKVRFYIVAKDMDELMKYIEERKSEGFVLKETYEKDGKYSALFVK